MTLDYKNKFQELLGKEVKKFELKGKGDCNSAYYVETLDGARYIVKEERNDKESLEQNNLTVEADVVKKLYSMDLSIVPCVVFVSDDSKMYGYEFIDGEMMIDVWESLSEMERIDICHKLGYFHSEIGKKITKEIAEQIGTKIDESLDVHPEVLEECKVLLGSDDVPDEFKDLLKAARVMFDGTMGKVVFQFIHNDSHHENILIKDRKISGIIDFGDAEYGEVAKEFSRYIRDYPDYFQHIVAAYEESSGNKLSYERLVSGALLCGFMEIVEDYRKGEEGKIKAKATIDTYRKLMGKN